MGRAIASYGLILALGAFAVEWLQRGRDAGAYPGELFVALIAAGFAGIGLWAGLRLARPSARPARHATMAARRALGVTERELTVLKELAAGRSNKEIARSLGLSPNTVKTHVASLFDKLGARRRMHAVERARRLDLIE